MLEGYKHIASSLEETPEKRFASLDIKEKINALETAMIEEHVFDNEVTIKDSSYGIANINKIEGRTVINLAENCRWSQNSGKSMPSSDFSFTPSDNVFNHINCYDWALGKTLLLSPIKITVSFYVKEKPNGVDSVFALVDDQGSGGYYYHTLKYGQNRCSIMLTPGSAKRLTPRFYVNTVNISGVSGKLRIINFAVFEGDHDCNTNSMDIYGVHGVGNGDGIKLTSCGANVFNHNIPPVGDISMISEGEYMTEKEWQIISNQILPSNTNFHISAEIKTNVLNYPVIGNNIIRVDNAYGIVRNSQVPKNGGVDTTILPMDYNKFESVLFSSNEESYDSVKLLMRHNKAGNGCKLYVKNIMIQEALTEDEILHDYQPYIGSEMHIKINSPLHGLPNGTCDTIEFVNGEYVVIRRCKLIKLHSRLSITKLDINSNTISRFNIKIPNIKSGVGTVISNFVACKSDKNNRTYPGLFTIENDSVYIDIPNSIFNDTSPSISEFGNWLNSGNYKLVAELIDSYSENIQDQEEFNKLLLFDDVTHIYSYDNNVFPRTTIKIPTNVCAEVDSVESALNILEKEISAMEKISLTSVLAIVDKRGDIDDI